MISGTTKHQGASFTIPFHLLQKNELRSAQVEPHEISLRGQGTVKINFDVFLSWVESFAELGYDTPGDPIHGKKLGAFISPSSVHPDTMTRAYAASSYYDEKTAARPNLIVMTEATVRKITLESSSSGQETIATGVEVLCRDEGVHPISVKQGGEIILSAGTVKSPHLLELSGIGKDNIEPVVNNPFVGENLQDHPFVGLCYEVKDENESLDSLRDQDKLMAAVQQYQIEKKGPLTGTKLGFAYIPLVDGEGRVASSEIKEIALKYAKAEQRISSSAIERQYDILRQLLADPNGAVGEFMLLPAQMNTNPTGVTDLATIFTPTNPGNYITLACILNRPFSRGSVHINSADPLAHPDYDPRFLSNQLDVEVLARGLQFIEKIRQCEPMTEVLKEGGRRLPSSGNFDNLDVARAAVLERCSSAFHPCGTCAMGPRSDGGVVNDRLIVHGTRNLRVVDASIFPMVPVGNIQATVYATAERASDIIKSDRASQ